jgi:cytochrome c-type biogenesis protein
VAAANGALFVAGFTTVLLLLGASAAAAGAFLRDHSTTLARVGGVLVLLMGLHLLGLARVPGLDRDTRALARMARHRRASMAGSYVVGAAFGAGWTPCIGPVLAGILTLAATRESFWDGMGLFAAYSLGLAVPFLLATLALDRFLTAQRGLRRVMPVVDRTSGVLLVLLGVVLVSGAMTQLSGWFARFMPEGLGTVGAWME